MFEELKKFFEENKLAIEAASSIRNGRKIRITILENQDQNQESNQESSYLFTKQGSRNAFLNEPVPEPDLTFKIPAATAKELITKTFLSVGEVGLFIFGKITSSNEKEKIHFKLNVGFLNLMTGGYLGVLTAGGSDVAKYLASKGLGNIGKLKETISKLKG